MQQVASSNAPSTAIVIPHFVFGGTIWLAVTLLLILYPESLTQHYFNPKLLALTHLVVLGWISMVIFGALYQLLPVIMEVKLFSETIAQASFILLACGAIGLAISFWNFWLGIPMHLAATLIALAVTGFAVNVLVTGNRSAKKSIEKDFIQTSVIWLLFTVVAGIALAINLTHPFLSTPHLELLKLHAHAGIVGWFIQLIMGVAGKLLPMFMVSHGLNQKKLKAAWYFVNAGLLMAFACLFIQWKPGIILSAIIVLVGIISFLTFIIEAFQKRVKKKLDTGMMQSALSFITMALATILVLLLLFNNNPIQENIHPWSIAYGAALLVGFISSLIMGQTYKTLPFIVWLKVYRGKVGKGKIPYPKDLYSEKVAKMQLWLFALASLVLLIGIVLTREVVIRIGGTVLLSSVLMYNYNMIKIVLHKPINHA